VGTRDPNVVLDHEFGKALPIDQDNLLRNRFHECSRRIRKIAGGDKDAFVGLLPRQGSDETLNLLSADGVLPAFRLDVDDIEAQTILVDHAVNALVIGYLRGSSGFFSSLRLPLTRPEGGITCVRGFMKIRAIRCAGLRG